MFSNYAMNMMKIKSDNRNKKKTERNEYIKSS